MGAVVPLSRKGLPVTATIIGVTVAIEQGGETNHVEIAAAFDPIRTPEAARGVGRMLGQALSENLERRLQTGGMIQRSAS